MLSEPYFHNEDAAYFFFELRLWPAGPLCPHCRTKGGRVGKLKGKSTRRGVYKCYTCLRPFTVKIGTTFESSHLKLHLWLQAIYLISFGREKITVRQLQQTLGIGLKTAWVLTSRIRKLTTRSVRSPAAEGEHRSTVICETMERAKTVTADRGETKPSGRPTEAQPSPKLQRPEARESEQEVSPASRKRGSRGRARQQDRNQLTLFEAPAGPPPDNRVQPDRFVAKAGEIGPEANPEMFEQVFRKVALGQHSSRQPKRRGNRRS